MKFKTAIVRPPGPEFVSALTSVNLGVPDIDLAVVQHQAYVKALESCGLKVVLLEADDLPDSTFVEDVAICTEHAAILTRPGAPTRMAEVDAIRPIIHEHFDNVHEIGGNGTLDGGDVLEVDGYFYIGLSDRTNEDGARQLLNYLAQYGYSGVMMKFPTFLHLKSGVSYLDDDYLLLCSQFKDLAEFRSYRRLIVKDPRDAYGANAICVNGRIFLANGYPEISELIREEGFKVIELDMSEFGKADGGLSCLSLRF